MAILIPGVCLLSEKSYKKLLNETLIKTKIIIDQLDKLMREAMGEDDDISKQAFMKLMNIVNSVQEKKDD